MHDKYILIIKQQLIKATKKNEVPIAALIVSRETFKIYKSYNKKHKQKNPLKHAEINVITKMAKHKKDWRLDDCILYVSLEPCDMCKMIIKEARINEVYYMTKSNYHKNNNESVNYKYLENEEIQLYLTNFFKNKRKKTIK